MIPYGKQQINQDDIDAVTMVLQSDFLTQGPQVPLFEQSITEVTQAPCAVAVNSATSALHIACMALGLSDGDTFWTTPNSFVASANCGLYCGAQVDFVDIDAETMNLCPQALAKKLEHEAPPKVLVVVDFAGEPADLLSIQALSKRYGFSIIEDASHAIGARYQSKPVGCGDFADITIFSFHPVKIITTAEGGVATTANAELAERMRELRSHGITRDTTRMRGASHGGWYYQQIGLGYNYRMTEMQAALGVSQLHRLEVFISRREQLAKQYDELLGDLPVRVQKRDHEQRSALHLYPIQVADHQRKTIYEALRGADIGVNVHYIPIHTQPYYQNLGFNVGDFPKAEAYYAGAISLPLHAELTDEEQRYVVVQLEKALQTCA